MIALNGTPQLCSADSTHLATPAELFGRVGLQQLIEVEAAEVIRVRIHPGPMLRASRSVMPPAPNRKMRSAKCCPPTMTTPTSP